MAKDNIEVEIKIPANKKIFENVRLYLKKHGKLVGTSREIDKYYNSPHRNFLELKHPVEYLRIRSKSSGSSVTYKKVYFNENGRFTHADEYESKIEKMDQMEKIFSILNFDNFITIDKKRETFEFEDKFEIDLDTVKDLGYFIEIEAKENFGGKDATHERLADFAKKIGLDPEKQDSDGYVLSMMKKKGLAKS